MVPLLGTASFLIALNAAAFGAFWYDKRQAQSGGWRVPEKTLLLLALVGGWPLAKLAQRRFRHKTRKQPFATLLNLVPFAWVGLALIYVTLGPSALEAVLRALD